MPIVDGRQREKFLTGEVAGLSPSRKNVSLHMFEPLTDRQYEAVLNDTARELNKKLNIYDGSERATRILRARTLATVREKVRMSLDPRLRFLRENQKTPDLKNDFETALRQDILLKIQGLAGSSFDPKRFKINLFSAAETLLDFGGGVDCFVELGNDLGGVSSTCLIDLKSKGRRGEHQHKDKLTDVIFYYNPGLVNRAFDRRGEFHLALDGP